MRRETDEKPAEFVATDSMVAFLDFGAGLLENTLFSRAREVNVTDEATHLTVQAEGLESAAARARTMGDETAAEKYYREALRAAMAAKQITGSDLTNPVCDHVLQLTVRLALNCGEVSQARQLIDNALAMNPAIAFVEVWTQFRFMAEWPDAWLIAAVRIEVPDEAALNELVNRHWKALFARCQMLVLNATNAADLAQETWRRVLQTRQRLKPGGSLAGYLATIATNLWRDSQRSARRAGPMAEERLASLDTALPGAEDDSVTLKDVLPDASASQAQERKLLALDIDQALEQLEPLLRDVLVARFLTGESCAEIGARYGRTEQTVSGWVRTAVRQLKFHFEQADGAVASKAMYE